MVVTLASLLVQLFGVAISIVSVLGLVMPSVLIDLVRKVAVNPVGLPFAVTIRIVLGASLLTAAPVTRFPVVLTALGWITIIAAIILLFIGQRGMQRIADLVARLNVNVVRVGLALGAVFGVFLVYAVS